MEQKNKNKTKFASPQLHKIKRLKKQYKIPLIILLVIAMIGALGFIGLNAYTLKKDGKFVLTYRKEAIELANNSKESDFILNNPSKIYDDSGKVLTSLRSGEAGSYIKYDQIPANVVNSFIAVEDRTFWDNDGISFRGTFRAVLSLIKSRGAMTQGGSTITQQLVRTIYLTRDKSIGRKIKEIYLSERIAKKYSKQKIMEYYVNSCCFSNNIYGINDAAHTYFNKSPKQLTLSQAAYLCSIPNRPAYYNPYKNSDGILVRRNKILNGMLEEKMITQEQYDQAIKEKITVVTKKNKVISDYASTYAIHSATLYLMKHNGFRFEYKWDTLSDYQNYRKKYTNTYNETKQTLYTNGYTIKTTLNANRQKDLQNILNTRLSRYSTRKNEKGYVIQGSMTIVDNQTHKVVGIIGGRQDGNQTNHSLNRAFQSPRQPGSSIKPIISYTPGIEIGANSQTYLKNVNVKAAYNAYRHGRSLDKVSGEGVTLDNAVHRSLNGCALYLYQKVTPEVGLNKLVKMNFNYVVPNDYVLASALGGFSYGATTYEMANAYSTLANDGVYTQADCISSIKDRNGKEIYTSPTSTQVYEKSAAQTMTKVLRGVISSGTARRMGWGSSTQAAGKTGTTNSNKDAWFCGYTPYYSIAVWSGTDDSKSTSLQGSSVTTLWKAAQMYMLKGKPSKRFDLSSAKSSSNYNSSLFPNNNRRYAPAPKVTENNNQNQTQNKNTNQNNTTDPNNTTNNTNDPNQTQNNTQNTTQNTTRTTTTRTSRTTRTTRTTRDRPVRNSYEAYRRGYR